VELGSNIDIDMDSTDPKIQSELDADGYANVSNKVERAEVDQEVRMGSKMRRQRPLKEES
jgi:hypothetical protein